MSEAIVLVAAGASTPIGRDVWASAAAVRAGISGVGQHPYMVDSVGEPMRVATAPWLDIDLSGADRLEALLRPAVDQVLAPILATRAASLNMAIALGLPSPRPGLQEDIQQEMIARLRGHYGHLASSAATFASGHAAGLIALDAACAKLRVGALDACVVAGVDSYIEPLTLEWLESCDQLHGAGSLNNAWGFIPGEAGSAVMLMRESLVESMGLTTLAVVLGTGLATERNCIKTETVCLGEGLTQAFRNALSALGAASLVTDVYCDMNGEPYRADEYGFTCLRTRQFFASPSDFVAPADCWGDTGAAGAPLHLSLAAVAGCKAYAKGGVAFAWASSEKGERAAALLATGRSA